MNVDKKMLLTNEQRRELREWEALFKLPAWQWIVEHAEAQKAKLEQFLIHSAMTEGDLREARGMILALTQLISMEALRETEYNQMIGDAELARDELNESQGANS